MKCPLYFFTIKFSYNVHSDWLKQRTLSENKEQVNDIKLAFKFLLQNFDKFDPDKININKLFVRSKYGSWRPSLSTVVEKLKENKSFARFRLST